MIRLENATKTYFAGKAKKTALSSITLEIGEGDFVSIMGPSGSGKSTLLNIIGCMDSLTEGGYFYAGKAIHTLNNHSLSVFRRNHIGFIFQHFALMDRYTVFENVEVPLLIKNVPKKKRKKLVSDVLSRMGIADISDELPNRISGGEQQRCAIARALVSGNNIILADEPTGALDQKTGNEFMDVMKDINREGNTILIVTHNMSVAEKTNRMLRLEDGVLLEDNS